MGNPYELTKIQIEVGPSYDLTERESKPNKKKTGLGKKRGAHHDVGDQ
jgi:hypothetical protein